MAALALLVGATSSAAAPTSTGAERAGAAPDRACAGTVTARRATLQRLRRAGFEPDGAGVWTRRVGRVTITICTRPTTTPRWLSRPLGAAVEAPRRRSGLRSREHSISSLSFPRTLNGRMSIDLPDELGTSGWQMLDVPPAPVIRHHGGARYATDDYDVLYEAGYGRVKESIVVHRRQGTRTWSWKLHWTKGSRPYVDGAGRVIFGGKVALDRPVVLAANGRTLLRPRWTVKRNVVSFTVDDRRLALPYVVDPTADFPQRIHPDKVAGTRINGAEDVRPTSTTPASSCTKLPIDATGEALFGSMIARRQGPGAAIATASPSGGPNGWALQDGTSFPSGKKIFGIEAPTDSIIVAVGEEGLAIRSTDGGCSWTRLSTGTVNSLRGVSSPSPGVIWVVGDNGTARRSTDGGATFANVNATGSTANLRAVDSIDASNAWVVGQNRTVAVTTNGGATWSSVSNPNMGDIFGVTMLTPDVAWVVTDPGKIFKTTNGGGSWAYQANTGTNLFDIDSANSTTAWAVGDSGIVYRTTDGANWVQLASGVATRLSWVEAVSATVIWAGGDGGTIILSTDGGTTWTPLPNAAAGTAIHDGTARSATLAWTGDDIGRVQRYYPSGGPGSWGWVSEANGGTTLSAGPWTVGARLCRETWSTGSIDVGFRARVWKVAVNGVGAITTSTPMTPWSVASTPVTLAGGACTSATVPLAPTVTSMLPTEHFYIEYGLRVYNNARANETLALSVADPGTYVDFSAPAADSTPVPTNLRVASTIGPNGWTNDTTPTLRANLVDPDWWHHNRYQVCADAACTTVVAEGTSAAGQVFGSTNDEWTAPILPDGFYFIRTRTEEDGGETDMSAWTPINPDLAANRCAATNVGPCDKFGIDTAVPTAPAGVNDGTGTDIDWTGDTTSLSANWGASTDAGGINRYEYCMSTTVTGSDCTGTLVQAWTTAGPALGVTRTGLSLSNNTLYYTCVRTVDNAGNTGPATCSDGVVVDTSAPPATAGVRDGTAADRAFTPSATQLDANWDAVTDIAPGSGLQRYDGCFSASATGADCGTTALSPWASTGVLTATSRTVAALADGTTYFACVRAVDNVGNIGATRCSNGITVDLGSPTGAWTSWTENSAYLYSPGGSSADLLWYNPAAPLEAGIVASATVTATDTRSGMDRVNYPDLAAGAAWGPGGNDTTVGVGDTWTHGYTFTGGGLIGDPAPNNATAYDKVGNSTGAPALAFRIEPDGTGPVSPAMDPMSGLQNTVTYAQSISLGTDSQSGITRWVMDVQFAPLYDGVCGAWDPWIDGSSLSGYSGTATNGSTLSFVHYLNDPNLDLVADYKDAFCFRDRVRVYDNVENVTTIAENGFVRFDFGVPDVGITGPPDGSSQSGTFPITGTTDDVWPGGGFEYVNTGSGIQEVVVTYALDDGPDADLLPDATGSACAPIATFGGPWTAHTWSCSWATGPLDGNLADGWYTVSARARDRAGNLSTIATRRYLLDNKPPVVAWNSWNDYGSAWMHAVGNLAWVNPTAPSAAYQLDARVTARDLGSGVNRVEFPGLGSGWTPATGPVNATFTSPLPVADAYTMAYTFTNPGLLVQPGLQSARAVDGAGNGSPIPFEVRLDGGKPTGVAASVAGTRQSSPIVAVTLAGGADGVLESGLGSWTLQYDVAPLTNDTCGAFSGVPVLVATGVGIAPSSYSHDVTALGSQCYRYILEVRDNVGNATTTLPTAAQRVDLVDPTVDITSPADGSVQGGTFSIGGGAVDAHTGVDRVALTWAGPSSTSGTICDPATLGGTPPNWSFTCSWATGPTGLKLPDGTYTVTATSYDRAGRVSAVDQISIILDNNPPFTGFHSFDTSATTYAHWAGPVGTNNQLWYNPDAPAGVHSFNVLVTASDPNGVPRVEFPGAGAGWTPGSTVATQTVAIGPADRWSQTYSFDTSVAVADPLTLTATAYDPAGNPGYVAFELTPDLAAPALGTLSYPNGFHGSTSVTVNVATGNDGTGSGIRSWQLLRSNGTLSGTSCGGWSAYSLSVGTGLGEFTGTVSDTVGDPGCFRYRLVVTDNVGRVGTFDGTDVTMIDLTPPTGSLALAEGTNPQYQYLASSTRIFVNTNAPASGTFTATVNATAASGILDVRFPVLATGFTGDSVKPGPGPTFVNTYAWTGPAGSPPTGLKVDVRSNSLGPLALPFEVIADANAPTALAPTHASGFTTATSVSVSWTSGSDGTGSGVLSHQLERETGTLASGACTWSGTWTTVGPLNGPATQTDPTLAHATCYRYRTTMVDNVGNVGSSVPSAPIMVDTTAPTGASITLTEGTNPTRQWVSAPDTIWVAADPGTSASFSATVTATDPESGTGVAVFPALGSTFVYTSTGDYTASYDWTATATNPTVAPVVQVANGSGLTTTIPFTVNVDADAPSGATLDQEAGFVTDFLVDLSYTTGNDGAGSGIATWRIERRSALYDLTTDSCGAWAAWTVYPSAPGQPASPHVDSSVDQPYCYQYQLLEIDQVGNATPTSDGETVKVIYDVTPPEPFSLNLPTNPALPAITTGAAAPSCAAVPTYATATPTVSWSASSDTESGLSHYDVYVDGITTADATVAAPGTSWTSPALTDGGHALGVRALDYRLNFRNAGPAFPTEVRIDTAPPTGSLAAPAAGSWTGDTTPTLDWTVADTNCVARVEVYLDGGATPVAVASGSEPSWTPTTPLSNGAHTWSFTAIDTVGNAVSFGPYAFGVDTTPPASFTVTAPTAGQTVRGFVDVSWTASSDADSGLATAATYQVWVDGALRTTVGPATTSATIGSITSGGHSVFVRAFDAVGNSIDTAPVLFTGYGVIPKPVLLSPADDAFVNSVPTLDWDWPSDGGPSPTSYDVLLNGANVGTELHPTTVHAIADPGDGNHTWQVVQRDPYTGTVSSNIWNFILDRTAPSNPGPLSRSATTVSWPRPTDPAAPVASGIAYQEFWIEDSAGTRSSVALLASATSRNYGALADDTYTMWVRAYDRAGNFTDSPSIVVVNDSVPPTAFNLTPPAALPALPAITHGSAPAPSCATAPTYVSAMPTLEWAPSSDATSGLAGYDVYIDGAMVATVGPTVTSHTVATPLAGGAHTWHVVARDVFGLSRSSTPNPMNVRVDGMSPSATYGAPADGAFTSDTTPVFSWAFTDDNCAARVELTVGANVYVLSGAETAYAPSVVLPEGPTTWSLRVFDSAGNVVSAGPARTVTVDTTAPTGVTAVFPLDGGTPDEQMMTFEWSAGTDGGAGVQRYDLIIDGAPARSGITTVTAGTFPIYAGPHTWAIRAYDAVGNSRLFNFSFNAQVVPDVTAPDPFDLRSPADGAVTPAGTALEWQPAWDFKGVTQYRVYIDGVLAGTTAGNVTSFTPAAGAGAPICTINYDPAVSAGCITGPTYSWGTGSTTAGTGTTSPDLNLATYAGWAASGAAIGVGDPTVTPITDAAAGFDGDRVWTAVEYDAAIPAAGADIRFEHRYLTHTIGQSAYDGATVELKVDDEGDGFGNDLWESTCEFDARAIYGTTLDCMHEIVDLNGGYTSVMGGATKDDHPLSGQHSFAGDSGGTVQTRMSMLNFAGMNVRIRFRLGMDSCYVGMPADWAAYCDDPEVGAPGYHPAQWRIDDVTLAESALQPGLHTWYVVARDAAGNARQSTQTWTFDLQ